MTFCGASGSVRSVANLTRKDGEDFFRVIETIPVRTTTETFPLGGGRARASARCERASYKVLRYCR